MRLRFVSLSSFTCMLLLLIGATSKSTIAHGGGAIQLENAPAGPYLLSVWLSPPEPKTNVALHVTIGVTTAVDENNTRPVLDADILVQVIPIDVREPIFSVPATTEQSVNKLLYEADMTVEEPGTYRIKTVVTGTEGEGNAAFTVEVQSGTKVNWFAITLVAVLIIGGIILFRRRNKQPDPSRR